MSFNKNTTFSISKDDIEVIDSGLIKTAAMKLPDGFSYDPDYLYVKLKAVSAGEFWGANKNDDYFPEAELVQGYKTFLSAHTFKNHENKKIENAIGDVLTSEWSDKMKSVYLMVRIDNRIAPSIVRGFEKGFMTDFSMGCRVDHVICSYCGQEAKTRFDYCDHLKTMKGKIMSNGKKVYEINIGPKFHDISAVLNGAERTAKAEGLIIRGDKVAFNYTDNSLEKTASFEDTFKNDDMFKLSNDTYKEEPNIEVIASSLKEDKKVTVSDIDKAKEKIKSKAVANALDDISLKSLNTLSNIADVLKTSYTNYWDKAKCIEIGQSLKEISKVNRIDPEHTFAQFLKVLDFSAIELSPLEIHDIFFETMNFDSHDLRNIPLSSKNISLNQCDLLSDKLNVNSNIPTVLKTLNTLRNVCDNDGFDFLSHDPVTKIRATIIKNPHTYSDTNYDSLNDDIMSNIVSSLLQSRSNHRPFAIPRLIRISNNEVEPYNNTHHFSPIKMITFNNQTISKAPELFIPAIMSAILHSAYQHDRVKRANDGTLNEGIQKIAHYIDGGSSIFEKTAKISRSKAIITGIPLVLSYSALQRSRMNNGEPISSFNRYIAENPSNAAALYSLGSIGTTKVINNNIPKIIKSTKKIISNIPKMASENNDNIFDYSEINKSMINKGYSNKDLSVIKYASVLNGISKQDLAENLLNENDLKYSDIDEYLKTASSCFTIEFEKNANNFIKDISDSVIGDVIFNNSKKGVVAASMPGYLADGLIFAGIGKGLKLAVNKNKKGEIKNVQS